MATLPFACTSQPLSTAGFTAATSSLGVDSATLWALLSVETPGSGYLVDRRPQILFERHIFHQLTGGAWDASNPDISNPSAGGYGPGGTNQYVRLGAAVALNQDAALQSASWGIGQVMGEHYANLGFASISDMVTAMAASEDQQLSAVVNFITANNLQVALQNQDWTTYASRYNGADYAKNKYDTRLASAYSDFSSGARNPNLTVRTTQTYLTFLKYNPQGIDGLIGSNTLTALHNFQNSAGLSLTSAIDDNVVAALSDALPPAVNLLLI
jgi:hypothetical protein